MEPTARKRSEQRTSRAVLLLLALLLVPSLAGASIFGIDIAGQPGSVPWQIADVKPGFHGTGTVTITNTRSDDCSVVVWVGNITGDYALGQYMLYSVSGPRFVTSMRFPARIYDFPRGPDDPRAITVSPVHAGETITLDWTWEFQETGRPQNEAQGKQLGFNVYYTMLCPPFEMSGWYNVTPEVYRQVAIPGDPCYRMNQILQEFRVYTCTPQGCTYIVTDYRWLDLGPVLIDEDGDGICDADKTPTPTPSPTTTRTASPITPTPVTTASTTTAPTSTVPVTTSPTDTAPTRQPTPVPTIDQALCPPLAVPTGPVTKLTGPSVITVPGFYVLGDGAVNTTVPVYIDVRSSGVTIDGMGHTIDGVDRDGSYGIRVRGDGSLENIVVQNVTVTDFAYGIALFDTNQGMLNRVGVISNTYDGIMMVGGDDNEVACSLIHRDDDGINMTATTRARVRLNTVTENVRGSGIHVGPGSTAIAVTGNIVGANDEGIEVEKAREVAIRSNRVYESRYRGLNLTAADETTIIDNYLSNRENVHRHAGGFTGAWSQVPGPGPNVMGNPSVGGNYWGAPDGTGFSDTMPDRDRDGFVDGTYVVPDRLGIDFYPLGPSLPSRGSATTPAPSADGRAGSVGESDGAGTGIGIGQAIVAGEDAHPAATGPADATTPSAADSAVPTPTQPAAPAGMAAAGLALPMPALAGMAGLVCLLVAVILLRRRRR